MKIEIKNNFVNQKSINNRMQRFQSEKKKFVRKIELFEKVRESQEKFILKNIFSSKLGNK